MLVSDKVFYKIEKEWKIDMMIINEFTLELLKENFDLNLSDLKELTWYMFLFVWDEDWDNEYTEFDEDTEVKVINIIEYIRYLYDNKNIKTNHLDFEDNWLEQLSCYGTFDFIDKEYKDIFNKLNII